MAKKLFLTPAVVKYNYNIFSIKQPWGGGGGGGRRGRRREGVYLLFLLRRWVLIEGWTPTGNQIITVYVLICNCNWLRNRIKQLEISKQHFYCGLLFS